jgi:hypothetical protein
MTKPDISPLPNSYGIPLAQNGDYGVKDKDGYYFCNTDSADTAAFIVEACNNYHRLEAENKALTKERDYWKERMENAWVQMDKDANAILNFHAENKALREQQEWISVEDRLPEIYEVVLGYIPRLKVIKPVHRIDSYPGWYVHGATVEPMKEIPCWKPLPPPPKEDGV